MEFKFEANQEYQLQAIQAVTDLFEGQPRIEVEILSSLGSIPAVSNRLDLDPDELLNNLQSVQTRGGLPLDDGLLSIEQETDTAEGKAQVSFLNFSVEMETGTGKTYVYLRTILELFKLYGFRKYIVVVPSIAIREGVLKTLEQTQQHFRELYSNTPYRYYVYDSNNLSQVRQFSLSDNIEIMIMTIDAFNKAGNVIHHATDKLQGETPIHLVQAARPILILDEPQSRLGGEKNVLALAALNPLMALRYSATHRQPYNQVYRLTPFEAYRQNLVKRIEVFSVVREDDANQAFVELVDIDRKRNRWVAYLRVHKLMKNGTVKLDTVTVKPGDTLMNITNLPQYGDYEVDEIAVGRVVFSNGTELHRGEARGADTEAIIESQIKAAIQEHFRNQKRLKKYGVKVLTLFFIDRVASYRTEEGDNGAIRQTFDKSFLEIAPSHSDWAQYRPEQVQAAYFATARKQGKDVLVDTRGDGEKDKAAYDLIMRDKERLLSFDEPVSFIFSHSALNEGWDNPNIFQICTLRQVGSEITKRQQIGRGVRLAVNQAGDRIRTDEVNVLTVIANEGYTQFVQGYQNELVAEYGVDGLPPKPVDARNRQIIKRQDKYYRLSPEFKELWEKIKHKTRYAVNIDSSKVVEETAAELQTITVRPPRITGTRASIEVGEDDRLEAVQVSASRAIQELDRSITLPNLIERIAYLMEFTSPRVTLSRKTLFDIILKSGQAEAAATNPHDFATSAVRIIKERLADHLVQGIQYEKLNEQYEMSLFQAEFESWSDYLVPADHSLYDYIEFDSEIEHQFVKDLEARRDVLFYIKLPGWFLVPTPVGNYNPDWAIVMGDLENEEKPKLYLVRETKGEGERRPTEDRKIECGGKHFKDALGVDYDILARADQLPSP